MQSRLKIPYMYKKRLILTFFLHRMGNPPTKKNFDPAQSMHLRLPSLIYDKRISSKLPAKKDPRYQSPHHHLHRCQGQVIPTHSLINNTSPLSKSVDYTDRNMDNYLCCRKQHLIDHSQRCRGKHITFGLITCTRV